MKAHAHFRNAPLVTLFDASPLLQIYQWSSSMPAGWASSLPHQISRTNSKRHRTQSFSWRKSLFSIVESCLNIVNFPRKYSQQAPSRASTYPKFVFTCPSFKILQFFKLYRYFAQIHLLDWLVYCYDTINFVQNIHNTNRHSVFFMRRLYFMNPKCDLCSTQSLLLLNPMLQSSAIITQCNFFFIYIDGLVQERHNSSASAM